MPSESFPYDNPHVVSWYNDANHIAAFVVFEALRRGEEPFQYVTRDGLDTAGLLDACRTWSPTQQILLKAGLDLFDPGCVAALGHTVANAYEILVLLDLRQQKALLRAARLVALRREPLDEYLHETGGEPTT